MVFSVRRPKHCGRRRLLAVGASIALALALAGGPIRTEAARAADGLQFLDGRPLVIDLDNLAATPRWRVQVFQGGPKRPSALTLHVLFEPESVIGIVGSPSAPVPTGEVVEFVIELRARAVGIGELVVTSGDGAVARRPIRTAHLDGEQGVAPRKLRFSGTRLTPFGSTVAVDTVRIGSAPAAPAATKLGSIVAGNGDVADVVQVGRRFEVRGMTGPGTYSGTVDMTPAADGGDVEVTATVRDALGWPLVVLVLGLAAVQALERYQKRARPRRDLARRLAYLMDRARLAQDRVDGRLRIWTGRGGDLYLDAAAREALAAWDRGQVAAEWATWEVDGAAYQAIEKAVDDFRRLTDDVRRLGRERDRTINGLRPVDRDQALAALEDSPVGRALATAGLATAEDIVTAAKQVEVGRSYLGRFATLYDVVDRMADPGVDVDPVIRDEARQIRAKLLLPGVDLGPLEKQADALLIRWGPVVDEAPQDVAAPPPPLPPAAAVLPAALATAPEQSARADADVGGAAPAARRRHPARTALALAALGLLAGVVVLASSGEQRFDTGPPAGPNTATLPPTTEALRLAPVAGPPTLPPAFPSSDAGPGGTVLGTGFLAPLAFGAALAGGTALVVQARRRRRPKVVEDFDHTRLDALMRQEDRRFAVGVSGVNAPKRQRTRLLTRVS